MERLLFYMYYYKLRNSMEQFKVSDSYDSKVKKLTGIYSDMKKASCKIHNVDESKLYSVLVSKLNTIECKYCFNDFICDTEPDYDREDPKYFGQKPKSTLTSEEFMDLMVWYIRRTLEDELKAEDESFDLVKDTMANQCFFTTFLTESICKFFKVPSQQIRIPQGFTDDIELLDGNGYHYFTLVTLSDGEYIIDCTYRQFFRLDKNLIDRMGVNGLAACDPGIFMLMDEDRKKLAQQVLKKGWFKVTTDNFKNYMDGFALSFRNGLFYERSKQTSFNTPYDYYTYRKFIKGMDNQVNYETEECLGIQECNLEDPDYCKKMM